MRDTTSSASADSKFRQLILYLAWCCRNDGNIGTTQLTSILFYSDFAAYLQLGQPLTGEEYLALADGPAPKRLKMLIRQMQEQGDFIVYQAESAPGALDQRVVPQRKPDLSVFKAEEIAIVDQMLVRFFWKAAKDIGGDLRKFIGWEAAQLEEIIPYSAARLDAAHILGVPPAEISKYEIEHARTLEDKAKRLLNQYG